jgi:general secretion pathway protein K
MSQHGMSAPWHSRRLRARTNQRGVAILMAMLVVTLVAALSSAALWQQWRGVEVETAERSRLQSSWILQGALDWARLILREDARAGTVDHLGEPWAVPLQEARLSTFLAAERNTSEILDAQLDAFLSGQIIDLQGRLNVINLVQAGKAHTPTVRAFVRLFAALHLPENELVVLLQNLQLAGAPEAETPPGRGAEASAGFTSLMPRTVDQLAWLGLSKTSISVLRPFITVLPEPTLVNLNTAPELVLYACIDALDRAGAQRLVAARALSHFRSMTDVTKAIGPSSPTALDERQYSVNSRFFQISGRLRIGARVVEELSVVQRDGLQVKILWRERGSLNIPTSVQ